MWKKSTIRKIKLSLLGATVFMTVLYGFNRWSLYNKLDRTSPTITFEEELLEVSVKATEEELLRGVKATDKKDGDVTNTIIIEGMSNLLNENERIVTYVAFDKDNHIGKAERRIKYTDYTAPRFHLTKPLQASTVSSDMASILQPLTAEDCIDGDVTRQITVVNTEIQAMSSEGIQAQYEVQVTNSSGDVATLKLPVKVQMDNKGSSNGVDVIKLSEYLTYRKVGEEVDLKSFIQSVDVYGQKYSTGDVKVSSNLDVSTPGVYTATYSLEMNGNKREVDLIIVVEE